MNDHRLLESGTLLVSEHHCIRIVYKPALEVRTKANNAKYFNQEFEQRTEVGIWVPAFTAVAEPGNSKDSEEVSIEK